MGSSRARAPRGARAARPVHRYERRRPGTLVYLDIKKLGKIGREGHRIHGDRRRKTRGIGWEYVHVAIDDCTRYSFAEVLASEDGPTTAGFLRRATATSPRSAFASGGSSPTAGATPHAADRPSVDAPLPPADQR